MSRIPERAATLLPAGANLAPLVEWAEEARSRDETRIGVVVADDGRIIAHTHLDRGNTWRLDDAQALGIVRTAVDMTTGALREVAGMPVRHVTISEVGIGRGRTQSWTADDAPRLEERMLKHHAKVAELEAALRDARAAERDAARALHSVGVSKYRIAQILNVSQPTAARMVQ